MGVMECSRKGCESIMCSTYIDDVGYICSSCQSEFKELYPDEYPKSDLIKKLKAFMDSTKEEIDDTMIEADDLFKDW